MADSWLRNTLPSFPNVKALVLISPANMLVMPQQDGDFFDALGGRLPEDMQEEFDAFVKEYLDFGSLFSKSRADLIALNRKFGEYYQVAAGVSTQEQSAVGESEAGGWMVPAMYLGMGLRHDYRDALGEVKAPVLVIHGADDLQTERQTRIYLNAFPNATLHVIDVAGHFSFVEQPEEFTQVVGEFLDGLKSGS